MKITSLRQKLLRECLAGSGETSQRKSECLDIDEGGNRYQIRHLSVAQPLSKTRRNKALTEQELTLKKISSSNSVAESTERTILALWEGQTSPVRGGKSHPSIFNLTPKINSHDLQEPNRSPNKISDELQPAKQSLNLKKSDAHEEDEEEEFSSSSREKIRAFCFIQTKTLVKERMMEAR